MIKQRHVLTEAELVSAPAKQYMNKAQLEFFRQRLESIRADLIRKSALTSEQLRETEVATDPSDRATQEEEQAIELRARDRERKLLKKIDQALARIDDETYGYCEETGEPIGIRRLLARPTATLCLEAQERRERRERVYGN